MGQIFTRTLVKKALFYGVFFRNISLQSLYFIIQRYHLCHLWFPENTKSKILNLGDENIPNYP